MILNHDLPYSVSPRTDKRPNQILQGRIQNFPGGRQSRGGAQPVILPKFPEKLHENEGGWTEGASELLLCSSATGLV